MTLTEAARRVGVTPGTLRRWIRQGLIPQYDGEWKPAAIGQARVVATMRERGHSLGEIRTATEEGRLAFGFLEELFPTEPQRYSFQEAARQTGIDEGLVRRLIAGLGVNTGATDTVSEDELQLLRYIAAVLEAGFPLVALLQLVRVYGQAIARIADAEVRLFHLYVHEPLLRSGTTGVETAEQMHTLSRQVLPLAGPVLDQIHQRYLQFFVEQDVVGHMESDLDGTAVDLGRMRVAIAFADLTGYTRMTEEEGELSAVDAVERFVEAVEVTLPDDARIIKTIGDEVMIIGSEASTLTDWAVGFQTMQSERPLPRIAVHCGVALFRDGDYYGRDINIASRVAARSAGGEVLVTRPVVEVAGSHLEFERIGEVTLKGFSEPTEVFLARQRQEDGG
ncbi:MAG TPA: MerR family transcriptional regulator [Solirubrobacteraceae bacterium]|nr:MerR family transcriptional regulator [Solirubrobacteraceae bacterium]